VLRVLVDADNVLPQRIEPVLALLDDSVEARITACGRRQSLTRVHWPDGTELLEYAGWQRADLALAAAYTPSADPLLLISGDGDFALLATRHPGPVLVVSGAASNRLRDGTTVVDPAVDGVAPIQAWLSAYAPPP
jgi:hypothetical protein